MPAPQRPTVDDGYERKHIYVWAVVSPLEGQLDWMFCPRGHEHPDYWRVLTRCLRDVSERFPSALGSAFLGPMLSLAMVQMRVKGGERDANLARAAERVALAAQAGAQLIVLPEAMDVGWTASLARELAESIPEGTTVTALRTWARSHRVWICSGVTERAGSAVYNAAVLINADGEVVLHHRKLNELEIGHPFYEGGDRLGVVTTPWGTVGLMICADAFARDQVITRTLGYMGAQLVLSPCAWAVPADHDPAREPYGQLWRDNYGPVARDFRMWIAGVSNVGPLTAGPWAGRRCIGCSLLVGPDGEPVLTGPYGEDAEVILYALIQLEPRPTRGDGWSRLWAVQRPN